MVGVHGPSQWKYDNVSRDCGMHPFHVFLFSIHFAPGKWTVKKKKKVTSSRAGNDNPAREEHRDITFVFSRFILYCLLNSQPLVLSPLSFCWPFNSSLGPPVAPDWFTALALCPVAWYPAAFLAFFCLHWHFWVHPTFCHWSLLLGCQSPSHWNILIGWSMSSFLIWVLLGKYLLHSAGR